jgi:hypothetical protein
MCKCDDKGVNQYFSLENVNLCLQDNVFPGRLEKLFPIMKPAVLWNISYPWKSEEEINPYFSWVEDDKAYLWVENGKIAKTGTYWCTGGSGCGWGIDWDDLDLKVDVLDYLLEKNLLSSDEKERVDPAKK